MMSTDELWLVILRYIVALNAATMLLSAYDKVAAMRGLMRVSERLLLGLALLGGAPAAKFVQIATGHKTLKIDFSASLNLIVFLHLALASAAFAELRLGGDVPGLAGMFSAEAGGSGGEPARPRRFGPGGDGGRVRF